MPDKLGAGCTAVAMRAAVPRASWTDRLIAASVAALAAGVLVLAATLSPAPAGHGTHTQLGLTGCSTMQLHGRPCPTCGMTTAFAWFVRGDLVAALHAQVLGTVLAAMTLLFAMGGLVMAATGVHFGPVLRRIFVDRLDWLWLLIALGLGSWALKIYLA